MQLPCSQVCPWTLGVGHWQNRLMGLVALVSDQIYRGTLLLGGFAGCFLFTWQTSPTDILQGR